MRKRKGRRLLKWFGIALVVVTASIWFGNDAIRLMESDVESVSHGTSSDGSLVNGKRLPSRGENFRTYSRLGSFLGRTAVHNRVRDAVLLSYHALSESHPELRFVYGETGNPSGGRFRPHRTHQNGLSVDFMTPMMDGSGRSRTLSTRPWNLWGYKVELDEEGNLGSLQVDNAAIAAHLRALNEAARANGLRIWRVIYDPHLQPFLFEADPALESLLSFSTRRSWVRHDDHYHVDFELVTP